jgi:hypothetical protein
MGVKHSSSQGVVLFEQCIGLGEFRDEGRREGVTFGWAVQADQQDVSIAVNGDIGRLGH